MPDPFIDQARSTLKRPRPVLSCLECRRKKLKCDRLLPCQQCVKLNQPSLCTYAPGQEPELRSNAQGLESAAKRVRTNISDNHNQASTEQISDLHDRVRRLEEALASSNTACSTPGSSISNARGALQPSPRDISTEDDSTNIGSTLPPMVENYCVFEQFEDAQQFITSLKSRERDPNLRALSTNLSAIERAVTRFSRTKATSSASYTHMSELVHHMIQLLPRESVRQKLIDLYFENFEHCSRILHKSEFISTNNAYNRGTLGQSQGEYFVPALVGVLSNASNLDTYPECEIPTFHAIGNNIGAIQLLNNWYDLIVQRDGVTMPAIQVKMLTMQTQKFRSADAADLWISSAQLVRQAMTQHFHKECPPNTSNFETEIQRGLWSAILEQDLALAIACELPPLCPRYEMKPVPNCNDDDLSKTSTAPPPEYPNDVWTSGLCQHILSKTFNQRLEAYRHRFSPRSAGHYKRALEHARALEVILRDLPPLFRLDHIADDASNTPGRLMAQMDLDITLRRSLIATYAPYARSSSIEGVYKEVRVPWVQSHVVVMCFQDLFDPQFPMIEVPKPNGYWVYFWTAYRYDVTHSIEAMFMEANYLKHLKCASGGRTPSSGGDFSTAESPARVRGWDFSAMVKSIEDTLDPMTRRIGACGGDLRSVTRYTVLYDCLRTPIGQQADAYILQGLQNLTTSLIKRLNQESFSILGYSEQSVDNNLDDLWLAKYLDFNGQYTPG